LAGFLFSNMPEKQNQKDPDTNFAPRPPIVVVLGHVDHGKTSILDKIRQTKVAEKETGGITQHIGAYQVEHKGKKITFLDTPGHEAFSAIRSRGARVADVAVLVVAADEGVKSQTKETIQIIKEAKIPFVVAINKTDKEGANPMHVKQELAEQEVMVEGYGGTVPTVELSARTGEGINELLEMILLVAELEELRAPLDTPAKGVIIESHKDSRRGLVATGIVIEGELKVGDWISAGDAFGRVKSLENFLGKPIKIATASQPCAILGWETAPRVGQEFKVAAGREEAEKISLAEAVLGPINVFAKEAGTPVASAKGGATGQAEGEITNKKVANLIVKADVQSSLEAIDQVLRAIHSEEVDYKVVNYGVGTINDADVKNAVAMKASIIGFRVNIDESVRQMAEREKISAQTFDIIYGLAEAVRSIMSELLEPEIKRIPLGKVKIIAIFKNLGKSQVVGGKVTQGKVVRGAMIDVIRNGALLITGRLGQLQHDKADVAEVAEGLEAGIRFDLPASPAGGPPVPAKQTQPAGIPILIKEGDVLEIYEEEKIKRNI
jgi:translation initiation factor IF-2